MRPQVHLEDVASSHSSTQRFYQAAHLQLPLYHGMNLRQERLYGTPKLLISPETLDHMKVSNKVGPVSLTSWEDLSGPGKTV